MSDWWCTDNKTDEDASNGATTHQLVPQNHVMEAIPFLRLDASDDAVLLPVLGDVLASGNWRKKTVLCALLVDGIWNLASLLPFFTVAKEVLADLMSKYNKFM